MTRPRSSRCCSTAVPTTFYDAGHVALAELADATLMTLDRRIRGAPGVRCTIVTP